MIVIYRAIPSNPKIKPLYSARPNEKVQSFKAAPKLKPKNQNSAYAESWKND